MTPMAPPRRSSINQSLRAGNSAATHADLMPQPLKIAKRRAYRPNRTISNSSLRSTSTPPTTVSPQHPTSHSFTQKASNAHLSPPPQSLPSRSTPTHDSRSITISGLPSPPASPHTPSHDFSRTWLGHNLQAYHTSRQRHNLPKNGDRHTSHESTDTGYFTAYSHQLPTPPASPTPSPSQLILTPTPWRQPRPSTPFTPPEQAPSKKKEDQCYICSIALSSHQSTPSIHAAITPSRTANAASYTFPTTAPLVLHAVLKMYPRASHPAYPYPYPYPSPDPPPSSSVSSPAAPSQRSTPRFCAPCFTTLSSLHLCWTCGQAVHRSEELVTCGWANWHWSCVSCLICRVPVKPPAWGGRHEHNGSRAGDRGLGGTGRQGESENGRSRVSEAVQGWEQGRQKKRQAAAAPVNDPRGRGAMVLDELPACGRCKRRVEELPGSGQQRDEASMPEAQDQQRPNGLPDAQWEVEKKGASGRSAEGVGLGVPSVWVRRWRDCAVPAKECSNDQVPQACSTGLTGDRLAKKEGQWKKHERRGERSMPKWMDMLPSNVNARRERMVDGSVVVMRSWG